MTGLYTDLYEIRMAASSIRRGMTAPATFSLFVRKFPVDRGFMVAAGLADCLRFLEEFRLGSVTKSALDRALFVDAHRLDLTGVHLGQQIGERHGRVDGPRPATGTARSRSAAGTVAAQLRLSWIAFASPYSRCSIVVGTSQA